MTYRRPGDRSHFVAEILQWLTEDCIEARDFELAELLEQTRERLGRKVMRYRTRYPSTKEIPKIEE